MFYGISGVLGSTFVYGLGKYIREGKWKNKNKHVPLQDMYLTDDGVPRYRRDYTGVPIDETYDFNSEETGVTRS